MRLIFKIIRKKYLKILLSITIIISLGVALLFGLKNGVFSVSKSVDSFLENNNYPDIKIITNLEDVNILDKFNKEEYKSIDSRLSISTILKKDDSIISVKASTYEDKNINDFYIWDEKKNNSNYYDILVERKFAENTGIKLGDIVLLKIDDKYYNFYISKIISIPEAVSTAPVSGLWGGVSDYGNVYINKNVLINETNKLKNELLAEVLKKEEELNNEEKKNMEEFNSSKEKIDESIEKYNESEAYYKNISNELSSKKKELEEKQEELLEIKNDYLEILNYINNIDNKISSYIDTYEGLSNDAKDYINDLIEKNYPSVQMEDLEFLADIGYYIAKDKIDEVFDENSQINKKIKNSISIADNIKTILESQTTDENIAQKEGINKKILIEIKNALNKLPFRSFNDLYETLNVARIFLPFMYDSLKNKVETKAQEILDSYNGGKGSIEKHVVEVFSSNQSSITKFRKTEKLAYNYITNYTEELMHLVLKKYSIDGDKKIIELINDKITEIKKGITKIDNNIKEIDDSLKSANQLINENKKALDEAYNTLVIKIQELRKEMDDKKAEIEKIKGFEDKFNEINIRVNDKVDKDALLKKIENNELKDVEILDSYTYDYSPVKKFVDYNLVGMERISTIIPLVFYIVILIVIFLFVSLIIKQSKSEIAIFRLLGKSKNEIRLGYCINNLIISIFGIALGLIFGGMIIQFIANYYKDFILLPNIVYEINSLSIIQCIIVTIGVVEIATIFATLELDKITPIEVLNKESYQNKKISKFTKLITNMFNPLRKFSFIVYIRNKRNLLLEIICTSATVAMIFTSLAYVASKDKIFNQYFDDRINYDAQLFKKGAITEEYIDDIRKLDYVESADLLRYYNVKLKNNDKEIEVVINAIDNKNEYVKIFDKDNNEINYPESGIVLEEHIANDLGLKQNDYVEINGYSFKIVNISFQSMGRINYISIEDSEKLNSSFETVVINMDKTKLNDFINKVSNDDDYIYTVNYDNLKEYNKKEFDSYVIPAIIIIAFAMIIGFVIIININNYNLIDQKRNLSIFRSLGFQCGEISSNWFIQSILQWIISTGIGLPIGIIISKFILKIASSSRREYIYASGIKEILITVVLLFVYICISHFISMRKLKKIDIIEEVKGRD